MTRKTDTQTRKQQIAFVTGATSGLGKAVAEKLATQGYLVYGAARRIPGSIQDVVSTGPAPVHSNEDTKGHIRYLSVDVQDESSLQVAVHTIVAESGGIDVLVACAGMGIAGPVEETEMSEIEHQMDVNFLGTVRTVKACLSTMRVQRFGKIIVIGSIAGRIGMPFQAFYAASKFALEGFVESLRHEVRRFGIEVCIIEPGDFKTGFTGARKKVNRADSVYTSAFERVIAIQEHDEQHGSDPKKAASVIAGLLARRHLPARRSVGKLFQRAAAFLKRIIPYAWFETFYRVYYKV